MERQDLEHAFVEGLWKAKQLRLACQRVSALAHLATLLQMAPGGALRAHIRFRTGALALYPKAAG